ncbi:MAG: sulfatase-like hydrolase/transferase, partial [Planctomycetota bacterium]|nr:sulfatase-like hydrolase/transferase [Planctomycetota bacterium]
MTSVIAMSCLLAALPAASSGTGALPPDRGPLTRLNVVLLLSDDHMLTALGCAGNPRIRTPHLDRLAASGVRFTHCFSPNPICTPSRACLLTGQDSWTNGCTFFGKPIAGSSPLWPRLLADAGYETFFTGKWHNDGRPSTRGFTAGADIFVGGMYDHRRLPVVQYGEPRKSRRPASKYSSTLFVDAAIRCLEHREGDKPFALFVSFTVPHDPWVPPPGYSGTYRPADMPVPANFRPEPPFRFDREKFPRLRDQSQLPFPRTRKDVRQALARYYAMITHMDAEIGRLLEKLKEKNLAGRTLVIFTSDHGYSMGSHGFVGKQTM